MSYIDAKAAVSEALRMSQSQTRELATWGVIANGARADRAQEVKVPVSSESARAKREGDRQGSARRRRQDPPHEDGRGDTVDLVA